MQLKLRILVLSFEGEEEVVDILDDENMQDYPTGLQVNGQQQGKTSLRKTIRRTLNAYYYIRTSLHYYS